MISFFENICWSSNPHPWRCPTIVERSAPPPDFRRLCCRSCAVFSPPASSRVETLSTKSPPTFCTAPSSRVAWRAANIIESLKLHSFLSRTGFNGVFACLLCSVRLSFVRFSARSWSCSFPSSHCTVGESWCSGDSWSGNLFETRCDDFSRSKRSFHKTRSRWLADVDSRLRRKSLTNVRYYRNTCHPARK